MRVPAALNWLRSDPTGSAWLERLPSLLIEARDRWSLEVDDEHPFEDAYVSWVAPARREDDSLVLKIQLPHPECRTEAAALRAWSGDGAVRLVAHDPVSHSLLLERCNPGTPLVRATGVDRIGVFVDLLPQLWLGPPDGIETLIAESEVWCREMRAEWEHAGRPCEARLVDAAVDMLTSLAASQEETVLVHQDLHATNVLAHGRGWLAIDPKALVGERAFSVAPAVRDFELGHSRSAVLDRLDRLTDELALDRERARGWTVGQTVAWAFSSKYATQHFETVRWLLTR